ncbi:MAG: hypothetical protein LBU48_02130, partial [Coriobacteriales bacterium]|nr:hypothetical protein [Coriobacteriales bacterium]
EKDLITALKLDTDARGNVLTAEGSFCTSLNSVFVAGDMHRGQSLVVWALVEGRKAAEECHEFLNR